MMSISYPYCYMFWGHLIRCDAHYNNVTLKILVYFIFLTLS